MDGVVGNVVLKVGGILTKVQTWARVGEKASDEEETGGSQDTNMPL